VPKDLKIKGNEESFTITVNYDTLELYGRLTASRNIVIFKEQ